MINLSAIFDWAGANPKQRNIVEAERLLRAGHIIKCGKNINKSNSSSEVYIISFCLQTSNLKGNPHRIDGQIKNEEIIHMECSCKAGQSEKCKHIIATLLYINRYVHNLKFKFLIYLV